MPQISLYIDEDTLAKIEKAAKKEHISISKWVGRNIKESLEHQYPQGYFDLFGSIKDQSLVAERQADYKGDGKREEL
ncbi:MAG: toxin-antitoxin system, antitoxin component [Candidatus Delongbacteria bacterium]|nr:toxin-antitoxin system, antitoxin component [Candidatus Delongbacteria bacterium]MCG2761318.1 toxin-antitoxin system, antitoxin component [Candidatus Delongbacteria bacterium]